jgi:CheY-like chemotaxis protein
VVTPSTGHDRRRVLVLVVEDDPQARELYRNALQHQGRYTVFAVEDGLDALQYLESEKPAAVVLDLGLPRLPGRDVLVEMTVRGMTREIPVIVVTGLAPTGLPEETFGCILQKPVSSDQLVEAVDRCIAKRRGSFLPG